LDRGREQQTDREVAPPHSITTERRCDLHPNPQP
jgi:hypothetical protein